MPSNLPRRVHVVFLTFAAVFICYIDRVNISVAIIPMAEEFNWGLQTQGMILSSFAVGYILLQVIGGRLADRYGGKIILGIGVLVWSLFTILAPPAAALGITLLIMTRILMGMGEAVTFPSFYSLYGKWIPLNERARAVGFANSAIPLGTAFALIISPIIIQQLGWEWVFYIFGVMGFIWYAFWHRMVTSDPRTHPKITAEELSHIQQGIEANEQASEIPWTHFLKHKAVWAIAVAHFCNNWTLYVLLSWAPTFINKGLGVELASVGLLAMIPQAVSFISINLAGNLADRLITSGMPVLRVRKLMQTVGFGGLAVCLLLVTSAETVTGAIAIMALGSALGAGSTGGFAVNHMDIAPKHAGTLMGITNTAGTIPGIVGVFLSGMILELTGSWALVFGTAAVISLVGLVVFLRYAQADKLFD
mgnify:FL=1